VRFLTCSYCPLIAVSTLSGPETEHWTLRLAETLRDRSSQVPLRVLDLCTGTACIPLLLCASLPPRTLSTWAIDISPSAVELARDNTTLCGFAGSSSGNIVHVDRQDMFSDNFVQSLKQNEASWEPYDVLTSNPPYIPREQYDKLSHTVRAFEDPLALLGEYPSSTAGELNSQYLVRH
jgi:release factor glutamine methyltransferase